MIAEMYGYTHNQTTASNIWVIQHNLNCKPVVQIYVDFNGVRQRIIPKSIVADSQMQLTVTFSQPFVGHATLQ